MVWVLYHKKGRNKLEAIEVRGRDWLKCQTLLRWIQANPYAWKRIKNFVYKRKLNKGKKEFQIKVKEKKGILEKLFKS
jgi:hypothetical protein